MIIKLVKIEVQSRRDMEMIDITDQIERVVAESGLKNGVVLAMTTHTSSGLLVTEGVECLERDVLAHLERLAPKDPPEGTYHYWHNRYLDYDGRLGFNAGDHLKSILGGVNCFFPVRMERWCGVRGNAPISSSTTDRWPGPCLFKCWANRTC